LDIYKAFPGNELDDLLGTFLQDDNALTISTQLTAGSPFTVTSRWTNVNTAPAYIPWQGIHNST
jgi:hypothetical protein